MIMNQLQSVPVLATASHEVLAILIEIWRDAQSRIYSGFHKAAQAYFKYLQLSSLNEVMWIEHLLKKLQCLMNFN